VLATEETKLAEGVVSIAYPKGIAVAVVKKQGRIYALRNRCAHMSCGFGGTALDDYVVQCPCHDWKYDVRTGEFITALELKVPIYETKVDAGKVYVKLEV
jgi:3-phenylpropionate/trans-cinnamate dioxygenase ferredoxin subunit